MFSLSALYFKTVDWSLTTRIKQWERNVVLDWAGVCGRDEIRAPLKTPPCEATRPAYVNCKLNISYYPLPSGLFRENLQHWLGDFARLLKGHFTSNEGVSNDAPIHECESETNLVRRGLRFIILIRED